MILPNNCQPWVLILKEDEPGYFLALHLAVIGAIPQGGRIAPEVHNLLEGQKQGRHLIRPVVGAFERDRLVSAVVGVESPGSANLLLMPFDSSEPLVFEATCLAISRALQLSREYGVTFAQVVAPPNESNWDIVLRESGMMSIAKLIYLLRPTLTSTRDPMPRVIPGRLDWITYSHDAEAIFCEALRLSYLGSQDCPELGGIRTPYQALLTHRAAGAFDPKRWFVLADNGRPLGVLMLSKIPREPVVEVVYMGVSQPARGKGVAGLLIDRALHVAAQAGASNLILAVDERNESARRLYARWNFQEVARRAVWIANLCAVER